MSNLLVKKTAYLSTSSKDCLYPNEQPFGKKTARFGRAVFPNWVLILKLNRRRAMHHTTCSSKLLRRNGVSEPIAIHSFS